jgi:hypothetical protein
VLGEEDPPALLRSFSRLGYLSSPPRASSSPSGLSPAAPFVRFFFLAAVPSPLSARSRWVQIQPLSLAVSLCSSSQPLHTPQPLLGGPWRRAPSLMALGCPAPCFSRAPALSRGSLVPTSALLPPVASPFSLSLKFSARIELLHDGCHGVHQQRA